MEMSSQIRRAPRARYRLVAAGFFAALMAMLPSVPAEAADWSKQSQLNKQGSKLFSIDSEVGNGGYAIVGWSQISNQAELVERNMFGLVRVKAPGARGFGPPMNLGRVKSGPDIAIGDRGHTVLAWTKLNGAQYVTTRGPRTKWSKPQRIHGGKIGGAKVEVGPDGTAVLLSGASRGLNDPKAKVVVSTRLPGHKRFSAWRKISGSAKTVGYDTDLVVGRKGRATVVWAATCPFSRPFYNASFVDIAGSRVSRPKQIRNTQCVTTGLNLEADRDGFQYLRIIGSEKGHLTGLKLSVRRPGKPFPTAAWVSDPEELTGQSFMAVSRKGRVFLAWWEDELDGPGEAMTFATFEKDRKTAGPAEIANVRSDRTGRLDRLQALAFLPGGSLASIWYEHWLVPPRGDWRFRFGTKRLDPFDPRIDHEYDYPLNTELTPGNVQIDVAPDGSRLARWTLGRRGYPNVIRWMSAGK